MSICSNSKSLMDFVETAVFIVSVRVTSKRPTRPPWNGSDIISHLFSCLDLKAREVLSFVRPSVEGWLCA